ncbi:WD40-repeat-containing domain protein [Boletus reticuloceps]|uniref:WD40-repeat-containing domain protein n=1 Tax=Boletus reticuloceps TaxID=495285 RepID=A0A8I3AAG5_9AGAM|nr:WD40-repeat-containing domain protein [Boletus reticuloceps]
MLLLIKSLLSNFFRRSYAKTASFTAQVGAIYTLAISQDGQILASGGSGGVKLWNLRTRKEIGYSGTNQDLYGTVSCAMWIKPSHRATNVLCYGTGLGYLIFIQQNARDANFQEICAQRLRDGREITCLAWDPSWSDGGARIAVGMRDSIVQVLLLDSHSKLQSVFAGRLNKTVPKSIAFVDHDEIYVFGLFDGNVIRMKAADGTILREHHCSSVIGYAAVNTRKRLVVIDNAANGFTLYRLDRLDAIRTYLTAPPTVPVPKQVAFGEDARLIIGGSDNGRVYLFNRKSGELLEMLYHSNTGLVQAVAVRDVDGRCIIASASPTAGRQCVSIKVWARNYDLQKTKPGQQLSVLSGLWATIQFIAPFLFFVVLGLFSFGVGFGVARSDNLNIVDWATNIPQISRLCAMLQERGALAGHPFWAADIVKTRIPDSEQVNNIPGPIAETLDSLNALTMEELAHRFMDLARMADNRVMDEPDNVKALSDKVIYL